MSNRNKGGVMTAKSVIGRLFVPSLAAVAAAGVILPSVNVAAVETEIDLTGVGVDTPLAVPADVGGTGLVANYHTQPAGTGVFDPFLTLERDASGGNPVGIESAYNTDGHTAMYLDQQRPEWNTTLRLSDLAVINVNGATYYAFELDANEPGANKSTISVDNVRIYTSAGDKTLAGIGEGNLNDLGDTAADLRWAMNDPLKPHDTINNPGDYNIDTWIKLDSNMSDIDQKKNGGSGISDLILYVPTDAFNGANPDDYVWFYNLNGVHYAADPGGDVNLGAEAGYEEWRAVVGVPDGGSTLVLLGSALTGLGLLAGRRKIMGNA